MRTANPKTYFLTLSLDELAFISKWLILLLNESEQSFSWFTNPDSPLFFDAKLGFYLIFSEDEAPPCFNFVRPFLRAAPILRRIQIHDNVVNEIINKGHLNSFSSSCQNTKNLTFRGFRRCQDVYEKFFMEMGNKIFSIEICGWERSLWNRVLSKYCMLTELTVWCQPFQIVGDSNFWSRLGVSLRRLSIQRSEFSIAVVQEIEDMKVELEQIRTYCRLLTFIDIFVPQECNECYMNLLMSYGLDLCFTKLRYPTRKQAALLAYKCSNSYFAMHLNTPETIISSFAFDVRLLELRLLPIGLKIPSNELLEMLSATTKSLRKLHMLLFLPSPNAFQAFLRSAKRLSSLSLELCVQENLSEDSRMQSYGLNQRNKQDSQKYLESMTRSLTHSPSLRRVNFTSHWRSFSERNRKIERMRDACVPLRHLGIRLTLDSWQYLPLERPNVDRYHRLV